MLILMIRRQPRSKLYPYATISRPQPTTESTSSPLQTNATHTHTHTLAPPHPQANKRKHTHTHIHTHKHTHTHKKTHPFAHTHKYNNTKKKLPNTNTTPLNSSHRHTYNIPSTTTTKKQINRAKAQNSFTLIILIIPLVFQ